MTSANLISYVAQSGVVLIVGLLAPRVVGLRLPAVALRYWQTLLAAVLLLPLLQPWRAATGGSVAIEPVGVRLADSALEVTSGFAGASMTEWVLIVLMAVAAARVAWLGTGLLVLRSYRLQARPVVQLPSAMEGMLRGSTQRVRFLVSDRVPTPVTFGWRRPTVLVPMSFERLPEAHQLCIGCHELLHVRRRDWLTVMIEQSLRAVLWFHPAVRILLGRIELAREQLIDREVVRLTGSRRAYFDALMSMASRLERPVPAAALFLLNRSDLRERISLLAQEVHVSRQRAAATLVVAIAAVAVSGASGAALFPLTKASESADAPVASDLAPAAEVTSSTSAAEEVRRPIRYDPDAGITAPKVIEKVNPTYPEEARKQGIQGVVVCESIIDVNGDVVDVKVVETPHEVFIQPTVDAVRQWKFEPATKDGEPVDVIYTLTVKYALQ
jgi:TonB family protein